MHELVAERQLSTDHALDWVMPGAFDLLHIASHMSKMVAAGNSRAHDFTHESSVVSDRYLQIDTLP